MNKTISIILTSVLLAAGVFAGGWFLSRYYNDKPTAPVTPVTPGGVIDEQGNDLTQGVHRLPKAMTFLSANVKPTLKVTLTPDFLPDKSVDWEVVWHDPGQLPSGYYPATNYVTATPTADGSTEAQLDCKSAFEYQIRVIVKSRSNPEARAECVLDYAKNINDPGKICMTYADGTEWLYSISGFMTNNPALEIRVGETVTASLKDYTYFPVGTVEIPFRPLLTLKFSSGFQSYCAEKGVTLPDLAEDISTGIDMTEGVYERWFGAENWADLHKKNLIVRFITEYQVNCEIFHIAFGYTNGYRVHEWGNPLLLWITTDLKVIAESVELDNGNVTL